MSNNINLIDILVYDVETSHLLAAVFSCGEQVIRHAQLIAPFDRYRILTVSYMHLLLNAKTGKFKKGKIKTISYDIKNHNDSKLIVEFDKEIRKADVCLGKNSDSFDVKMLNASRYLDNLPALPEWTYYSEDLQKQFRRVFRLPSQALDYISKQRGIGGKIKMEMDDWIEICLKKNKTTLLKMGKYNRKDVADTTYLFIDAFKFCDYKTLNLSAIRNKNANIGQFCTKCGSEDISKTVNRMRGTTLFTYYHCNNHNGFAGKATVNKSGNGKIK